MESYFLPNFGLDDDPTEKDPDEKSNREKRLVNALKQTIRKLYVMFFQSVISIFDSFNAFLQAKEPLIHILCHSTLHLYNSLLSRIIIPEALSESDAVPSIDLEDSDYLILIYLTVYLLQQSPSIMQGTVTSLESNS